MLAPGEAAGVARWLPVALTGGALVETLPDGTHRAVVRRLRVEASPDGSIRVARDLLPDGTAGPVLALPARLGGGFVFLTTMGGTSVHHSPDFLGPLKPLARFRAAPLLPAVAPDRLLLRAQDGGRLHAIELPTGTVGPPVGMPAAPRIGQVFFADAFRGVADVDLLGLMATEDAGASWHPLGITGPFGEIAATEGGIVLSTATARYTVDRAGNLSVGEAFTPSPPRPALSPTGQLVFPGLVMPPGMLPPGLGAVTPPMGTPAPTVLGPKPTAARRTPPGPLGASPAMTTLQRGIGSADGTALVSEGGRIFRVSLADFSVVARGPDESSLDHDDSCRGVPFGGGIGFVCGGEGNGTSIHVVDSLLETREIARFAGPRSVRASGKGALVVSGACPVGGEIRGTGKVVREESKSSEVCALDGKHPPRAVRTRGDVGRERVMAFADGRVLVLEPPNETGSGQATLVGLDGTKVNVSLRTPELGTTEPTPSERVLREGFWTHDLSEVSPTEIATWVEMHNEVRGVRVHLDTGEITSGTPHPTAQSALAGLKGLTLNDGGRGAETVDGGLTWTPYDQPEVLKTKTLPGRFCSSLGCILPFEPLPWVRVGWGNDTEPTFGEAPLARTADDVETTRPFSLACDLVEVRDPPKEPPRPPIGKEEQARIAAAAALNQRQGDWEHFLGFAAPAVPKGFARYDNGSPPSGVHAELYAWTPVGATTRDPSRWLVRFADRFDPGQQVRSSSTGATPFATEEALADVLGYRASTSNVQTFLDPGGHAALLAIGRNGGEWDLVSAVEGRVPVLLAAPPNDQPWAPLIPSVAAAVFLDGAWVVATQSHGIDVRVAAPGETRRIVKIPRVGNTPNEPLRVVRRAHGQGVGILVGGMGATGGGRVHHVLPIDLDTGKTGEIIRLGAVTLGDRLPRVCDPGEDGWLVDVGVGGGGTIKLPQDARVGDPEVRARLDPGKVCLDGVAARLISLPASARPKPLATVGRWGATGSAPALPSTRPPGIRSKAPRPRPATLQQLLEEARVIQGPGGPGAGRPNARTSDEADPGRKIPLVATDGTGRRLIARCGPP